MQLIKAILIAIIIVIETYHSAPQAKSKNMFCHAVSSRYCRSQVFFISFFPFFLFNRMIYQAGQLIEKGTIKKVVEKNEETFWPLVRLIPDKKK